jgi:hypothetical protein
MQWPFESKVPPFLTNFNAENEVDQLFYQNMVKGTPHQEHIHAIKAVQMKREGESGSLTLSEQTSLRHAFANVELELLVMILDRKISFIAKHAREPYPGFYRKIGVWPEWAGHRKYQENQEKQDAELKSQLRVIKGGLA